MYPSWIISFSGILVRGRKFYCAVELHEYAARQCFGNECRILRPPSQPLPAPTGVIDPTVKQRFMKLAFRHVQSAYATELFRGLRTALIGHELLSWPSGNPAPTNDIRILLALGPLGRTQLEALPQLELVQTVSAGFESVDVDAASELGIWV